MIFIAWKNLLYDKMRFIISVLGIALAILLLFAVKGIALGISDTIAKYPNNQQADLFILQKGVQNMQMTSSFFPSFVVDQIRAMDGVEQVEGIYGMNYQHEEKDKNMKIASYLVGFKELGGPWKMEEGKADPDGDEVVVDFAFAQKGGFEMGDTLKIMGHDFKIAGISRETNPMGGLFIFADKDKMNEILKSDKTVNLALVKVKKGTDASALAARINGEIPLVNAITKAKLAQNDADMVGELFDPIINAIIFLVVLVSTAFIGLTIYNATLEKLEEYTILKAIGATGRQLFSLVFFQSLAIAMMGTLIGFLLSYVVSYLAYRFMPDVAVLASLKLGLQYFWIVPVMAVVAAYIPFRRIFRIDEADALRN